MESIRYFFLSIVGARKRDGCSWEEKGKGVRTRARATMAGEKCVETTCHMISATSGGRKALPRLWADGRGRTMTRLRWDRVIDGDLRSIISILGFEAHALGLGSSADTG